MAERAVLDLTYRTKKTGKGAQDATRELKGFKGELDRAKASAAQFGLAAGAVAGAVIALGVQAGRKAIEITKLHIEAQRAEQALIGFAGGAEEAQAALEAVRAGAGGVLDRITAAQNAARLFSMELANTADEAGHLTEIAVTLGASMGTGPQKAFEDFTLLLANQSILRLDTFGISGARVRERMQQLADQGIAPLDRQTRFLIATLEVADEKLATLAAAGFQATNSIEQLEARWRDLRVELAQRVGPAILEMGEGLIQTAEYNELFNEVVERGIISLEERRRAQQEFGIGTDDMFRHLQAVVAGFNNEMAAIDASVVDGWQAALRSAGEAAGGAAPAVSAFAAALGEVDRNISGKIGSFIEDLQFLAAGGAEIQQAFKDLQEGVQLDLIDEEEAERQAQILFVQAQNIETELGNITADQAAKNISETLGVSLEQARMAVGNIEKGILRIPSRREIEFYIKLTGPGAGFISGSSEPTGFQHGGSFMVGGMPGPDRNLVMFRATQGEQVTVTPRAGSPQPGMVQSGGDKTINFYNTIGSELDGMAFVEKARAAFSRL